jgi:hypothetical protein
MLALAGAGPALGGTPSPGVTTPEGSPRDVRQIGVPYLVDDFDGRVLNQAGTQVIDMDFNEFGGNVGAGGYLGTGSGVSTAYHSKPYAYKLTYNVPTGQEAFYWIQLHLPSRQATETRNLSEMEYLSVWLRGTSSTSPGQVTVQFKDGSGGQATSVLQSVSSTWKQYLVSLAPQDLSGSANFAALKEMVFVVGNTGATNKTGSLYIDDIAFVDASQAFTTTEHFQSDAFLDLVQRRTFQYFMDSYDPTTGLVYDRNHTTDFASSAATGFGLTAMVVGARRGWVAQEDAQDYVLKVLRNLWNTSQCNPSTGFGMDQTTSLQTNGCYGFYYHWLVPETGKRAPDSVVAKYGIPTPNGSEVSTVDTALLLAGVLTAREYWAWPGTWTGENTTKTDEIITLADDIYERVDWPEFLDGSDRFYMGWKPEVPKFGSWDTTTDETILINLLAIGSPTHPVNASVFDGFQRVVRGYGGHSLSQSWNGSMFQYFFANVWFDLYGKQDGQGSGRNWWANSVDAGLANYQYCRDRSATYGDDAWGLTAGMDIQAGRHDIYLGGNGAFPRGDSGNPNDTHGAVHPYGAISMIGFSDREEGIPVEYVTDAMQHWYEDTQAWGGWYGFRDGLTTEVIKTGVITPNYSLYPIYKSAYWGIDEGPIVPMIENYRTDFVRDVFMRNANVQNAVNAVFGTTLPVRRPYGGAPQAVPGRIEAEDFDIGDPQDYWYGNGTVFFDTTWRDNLGGAYPRFEETGSFDGVDIEATSDTGGGYNVGWIEAGEWLEYTVDVARSGLYKVDARVASVGAHGVPIGTMHVEVDGVDETGAMTVNGTGGWQNWKTISSPTFSLTAGKRTVRVAFDTVTTGYNLNWIEFVDAETYTTQDTYVREAEEPYDATVGKTGSEGAASGGKVHEQFGCEPNDPWLTKSGYVRYYLPSYPVEATLSLKVRYSKNSPSTTSIIIRVDGQDRGSFIPANQSGWGNFAEAQINLTGSVSAGQHHVLELYTAGQQYGVAHLDLITVIATMTHTPSVPDDPPLSLPYEREAENSDFATVGSYGWRTNASAQHAHIQFGCSSSTGWASQAGYVEYDLPELTTTTDLYVKVKYSKDHTALVPITVSLYPTGGGATVASGSFEPQNTWSWNSFAEDVVHLGSVAPGVYTLRLYTAGTQWGVADLDKITITDTDPPVFLFLPYTREAESPDGQGGGSGWLIQRSNAYEQKVRGALGCNPVGWQALAGYVEYDLDVLPAGTHHLYVKVGYSKNNTDPVPVTVSLYPTGGGATVASASFTPQNTGDWNAFTTSVVDLGNVSGGDYTLKFSTDGAQYGVADLDRFIITSTP